MPRAERLSSRLDTLLESVFDAPSDPFSLYWDIAAQLGRDQLAQAQTKIRKTLRQKGEIGAESAVLVACILHLTGFPAHRILSFLSLYLPGGIRLSLFDLAVSAIFLGAPPIPASLLYDLTQYTYLEKRLLIRKSMEISDTLRGSLSPAVLLYLYLLSLREDLSNENIQLIALIMKNCFPSQEVRTRIGAASLEEYGEIARAWKKAERRSLDLDINLAGAERRSSRAFDRNSASFFLDKYFSDEALSEMRASAPPPPAHRAPPRPKVRVPEAHERQDDVPTMSPSPRVESSAVRPKSRASGRRQADETVSLPAIRASRKGRSGSRDAAHASSRAPVQRAEPVKTEQHHHASARDIPRRLLLLAPTVCAAIVIALILIRVPAAGSWTGAAAPTPASAAPSGDVTAAAPTQPAPVTPPQPAVATTTYIVRPGDSLWKIFTSMRAQSGDRKGWMDFLSNAQSMNALGDPDRLQPGKVLTFSGHE